MNIYTIHGVCDEKLQLVKAEMLTLGAPKIRVVDCGDYYMALEGTHRIAAAFDLGIEPEFVIFEQDDTLSITEFDWFDSTNWCESEYLAGEVAGELFSVNAQIFRF